jgi:AraC-like DNA-binding protein
MPLNIHLDITKNLKNQFEHFFRLKEINEEYYLDESIGSGQGMEFLVFPGQMEFYHFKKSSFKIPVNMVSTNPINSEWFLIHINLSKTIQQKKIADELIDFHKHLPIGMLLYGQGLEIQTTLAPNTEMELASIHFSHRFLDIYFDNWRDIIDTTKNLLYEDLDLTLERCLYKALSSIRTKIECHANVLNFISLFLKKISVHSKMKNTENLHAEDVKNLFFASTYLRNPLEKIVPSVIELASIANMGATKFKKLYKQLFGTAPIQYRNKVRMEYARQELQAGRKTSTEISHLLGYSHPSNFTIAYKKYFNELPSSKTK